MFVHDFVYVDLPAPAVRERLLSGGGSWLSPLAVGADQDGEQIRVRVGPLARRQLFSKTAIVETGEPLERAGVTVIPVTWTASGLPAAFPVLVADLEVAALGSDQTQISLRGRYEPPLGGIGRHLDQLLLHRIAEACVRAFLRRLAAALEAGARAPRGTVSAIA